MKQVKELTRFLAMAFFLCGSWASGQSGADFGFRAVPNLVGKEEEPEVALGSTYDVSVYFFAKVEGVEAWSYGLCVDPEQQKIVVSRPGADLSTIALGAPPEFSVIREWKEESTGYGVTQAVVLDLQGGVFLDPIPPDKPVEVLRVTLEPTEISVGQSVKTEFCDSVGSPPVETLVIVDNSGFVPGTLEGASVSVVRDPPSLIAFEKDEYNLALSQGALTVAVRVRSLLKLYGFSFGVSHDPDYLSISEATLHEDLIESLGGEEPAFWAINANPEGGAGFTMGVVFDIPDPSGPPPSDLGYIKSSKEKPSTLVAKVTYQPGPQAAPGTTTDLVFTDQLGNPPVAVLFDVGSELVPNTRGAKVRITEVPLAKPFRRGDINADGRFNISDAVKLLRFQFGGSPLGYDCNEAVDVNDDGVLNLADTVYLLSYLFTGGTEPPAPFPDCGSVPTDTPEFTGCKNYPGC